MTPAHIAIALSCFVTVGRSHNPLLAAVTHRLRSAPITLHRHETAAIANAFQNMGAATPPEFQPHLEKMVGVWCGVSHALM